MSTPNIVLLGSSLLLVGGCAAQQPVPSSPPVQALATTDGGACQAAVSGADLSGWREVITPDFTFCVPVDWGVESGRARQGASTLEWGRGEPPRRVLGETTVTVPASGRRTRAFPNSDVRRFSEVIDGARAQMWRHRYREQFYTGARWTKPELWITGETPSPTAADLQLTIYRTVRFRR